MMVNHFQENCIGLSTKSPGVKLKLKEILLSIPLMLPSSGGEFHWEEGRVHTLCSTESWWVIPPVLFLPDSKDGVDLAHQPDRSQNNGQPFHAASVEGF